MAETKNILGRVIVGVKSEKENSPDLFEMIKFEKIWEKWEHCTWQYNTQSIFISRPEHSWFVSLIVGKNYTQVQNVKKASTTLYYFSLKVNGTYKLKISLYIFTYE